MKKSLLELDPDANALLILQRPNLQEVHPYLEDAFTILGEEAQENKKTEPTTTVSPEAEGEHTITKATALKEITSLHPEQKDGTPNEIVFRVSAKHLNMASPVFQKLINGGFRESKPNDQVLLEIRTSDWNAQALLVLLDIIHGHHNDVPKELTQEIVAHVALIADYYDCVDIVKVFYCGWEASFDNDWESDWPNTNNQGLTDFGKAQQFQLLIAWTFQGDLVFSNIATSAILSASGPIKTYLPIPRRVTDSLDQLFDKLYGLQEDLLEGRTGCSQECSCRLAGHLMRQMREKGLELTEPDWPFLGSTVFSVAVSIRQIETPSWTHQNRIRIVDCCKLEKSLDFDKVEMYKSFTLKGIG